MMPTVRFPAGSAARAIENLQMHQSHLCVRANLVKSTLLGLRDYTEHP